MDKNTEGNIKLGNLIQITSESPGSSPSCHLSIVCIITVRAQTPSAVILATVFEKRVIREKQDLSFQTLMFCLIIYLLLGWLVLSLTYAKTPNFPFFREKLILYLQRSSLILYMVKRSIISEYHNMYMCPPLPCLSCSAHFFTQSCIISIACLLVFLWNIFSLITQL